jgi:hypothetical protein
MATSENKQAKSLWPVHIEQWQLSGLSQAAYCRLHDLSPHQFNYWKRKSQAGYEVKPNVHSGFTRIQVDKGIPSNRGIGLSLLFNNGMRINGITSDTIMMIEPLLKVLR